jgi:hypothetical protein
MRLASNMTRARGGAVSVPRHLQTSRPLAKTGVSPRRVDIRRFALHARLVEQGRMGRCVCQPGTSRIACGRACQGQPRPDRPRGDGEHRLRDGQEPQEIIPKELRDRTIPCIARTLRARFLGSHGVTDLNADRLHTIISHDRI